MMDLPYQRKRFIILELLIFLQRTTWKKEGSMCLSQLFTTRYHLFFCFVFVFWILYVFMLFTENNIIYVDILYFVHFTKNEISAIPPEPYRRRFLKYISSITDWLRWITITILHCKLLQQMYIYENGQNLLYICFSCLYCKYVLK